MAQLFDSYQGAVETADRLAAAIGGKFLVVKSKNHKFKVVTRDTKPDPDRILYRTWAYVPRGPLKVQDTPENRAFCESNPRKRIASHFDCSLPQVDYFMSKYGWKAATSHYVLTVEEVTEALKTMTAKQYADSVGVYDVRVYKFVREHLIPRPVKRQKGVLKGTKRAKNVSLLLKIEKYTRYLATHTIQQLALHVGKDVKELYAFCANHGVPRPVRIKVGRPSH